MKRLTYSNSMQKRRHRHKLILPLWCILLLVTGCGNLYTGDESLYDPNHQDNQGDQTQLPVMEKEMSFWKLKMHAVREC